jgi:large subunit ribosomal protein L29
MKASDLREKSVEDLRELQASLARDTFQNRLKNFTNRLDDTSQIRKTKRDLARVITLLRERSAGPAPSIDATASPSVDAPASPSVKAKVSRSAKAKASPPDVVAVPAPPADEAPKKKKSAKKSEAKQS